MQRTRAGDYYRVPKRLPRTFWRRMLAGPMTESTTGSKHIPVAKPKAVMIANIWYPPTRSHSSKFDARNRRVLKVFDVTNWNTTCSKEKKALCI